MHSTPRWQHQESQEGIIRSYNTLAIDVQRLPRPELSSLIARITETIIAQSKGYGEPCDVVESGLTIKNIELARHETIDWLAGNAALPQLPIMSTSMVLTITGLTIREKRKIAITYALDQQGQSLLSSYLNDLPGSGSGQSVILFTDIIKLKDSGNAVSLTQALLNINLRQQIGFTVQDLRILKWVSVGNKPYEVDHAATIRPYTIASTTLYVPTLEEVAFEAEIRHLFSQNCMCSECYDETFQVKKSAGDKLRLLGLKFNLNVRNKIISNHLRIKHGMVPDVKADLSRSRRNQEDFYIQRDPRHNLGFLQLPVGAVDVNNIPLSSTAAFNEAITKYPPEGRFLSSLDSSGALTNTMRFERVPEKPSIDQRLKETLHPTFHPGLRLTDLPKPEPTSNETFNVSSTFDPSAFQNSFESGPTNQYLTTNDGRKLLIRESILGTVRDDIDQPGVERYIGPPRQPQQPARSVVNNETYDVNDPQFRALSPTSQRAIASFLEKRSCLEDFIQLISPINATEQERRNEVLRILTQTNGHGQRRQDSATEPGTGAELETVHAPSVRAPDARAANSAHQDHHVQFAEHIPTVQAENVSTSNANRTSANNVTSRDYRPPGQLNELIRNQNEIQNQRVFPAGAQTGSTGIHARKEHGAGGRNLSSVRPPNVHVEAVVHQKNDRPQVNVEAVVHQEDVNNDITLANTTYHSVIDSTQGDIEIRARSEPDLSRMTEAVTFELGPPVTQKRVFAKSGRTQQLQPGLTTASGVTAFTPDEDLHEERGRVVGYIDYDPVNQNVWTATHKRATDVTMTSETIDPKQTMEIVTSSENIVLSEGPRTVTSQCNEEDHQRCGGRHPAPGANEIHKAHRLDDGSGVSLKFSQPPRNMTRGPKSDHAIAQGMTSQQPLISRQHEDSSKMVMISSVTEKEKASPSQSINPSGFHSVPQSTRADIGQFLPSDSVIQEPIYHGVSTIHEEDVISLHDTTDNSNSATLVASNSQQVSRGQEELSRSATTDTRSIGGTLSSVTSDLDSENQG